MYRRVIAMSAAILGVIAGGSLALAQESNSRAPFKAFRTDGGEVFMKMPNGKWARVAPQQLQRWMAERNQNRSPHATQFTSQQQLGDYYVGIALGDVTDTLRSQLKLDDGVGIAVATIGEDSPASEAGVMKYDVLVRVDGQDIVGHEVLIDAVQAAGEEDRMLKIEYMRGGEMHDMELKPSKRNADVQNESNDVRQNEGQSLNLPENGQITPEWLLEQFKNGGGNQGELQNQINELRGQLENLQNLLEDQSGDE